MKSRVSPFIAVLLISFVTIAVSSIMLPIINPVDLGATDLINRLKPPFFIEGYDPAFPLGTDHLGRGTFMRLVIATRNSLLIAVSGMVLATVTGTLLGVVAGMFGGWWDTIIQFVVDVRLAVASIIVAIVIASVFGSTVIAIIAIIAFTGWASFARVIRGEMLQLKRATFIEASRSMGASRFRILVEHTFRNIGSSVIVNATLSLSSFILLETSLSFLGLGIQPPNVSLGVLVATGRDSLITDWWLAIFPCVLIVLIVLQIALIGDWVRDRLDPKLREFA